MRPEKRSEGGRAAARLLAGRGPGGGGRARIYAVLLRTTAALWLRRGVWQRVIATHASPAHPAGITTPAAVSQQQDSSLAANSGGTQAPSPEALEAQRNPPPPHTHTPRPLERRHAPMSSFLTSACCRTTASTCSSTFLAAAMPYAPLTAPPCGPAGCPGAWQAPLQDCLHAA